jgi:hypothetical protein
MPVSRRASDNAKCMIASTISAAEVAFEFDKTGVGVVWT